MSKRKIIIDTDPGHDDAIAIMMAGKHPKLDVLALTVVAGNQTLEKTVTNALHICEHLDIDVPIYAGMGLPMVREQVVAEYAHGKTGLDGHKVSAPPKRGPQTKHAINYIIDTLLESDNDITLVPIGPLTNIAMAMRIEPKIIPKIQEIVIMGGAYQLGNVTPCAEFNIFADPEAAHVVFTSGAPIVMMGLDMTNKTRSIPQVRERMKNIGNIASEFFVSITTYTAQVIEKLIGTEGGALHDATCIAWLIDPGCITLKEMPVEVEIQSSKCYGRTICDYYNFRKKPANARVSVDVDLEKFWNIVEDCIRLYGKEKN